MLAYVHAAHGWHVVAAVAGHVHVAVAHHVVCVFVIHCGCGSVERWRLSLERGLFSRREFTNTARKSGWQQKQERQSRIAMKVWF